MLEELDEESHKAFSPQFRLMYLAFLKLNNDSGWKKQFTGTFAEINKLAGGISKRTYYKGIQFLIKEKMIHYHPSHSKWQASTFSIPKLYLSVSEGTHKAPNEDPRSTDKAIIEVSNGTDKAPIPKPTKPSKNNKLTKVIKLSGPGGPFDFEINQDCTLKTEGLIKKYLSDPEVYAAFSYWREKRRSKGKKSEMSLRAIETNIIELEKLSRGSMKLARAILDQSENKGYDGLFELDEQARLKFLRDNPPAAPAPAMAAPKPPAPKQPLSKEERNRQTYLELIMDIRKNNSFPELYPWDEVWMHFNKRNAGKRIPQEKKEQIRKKVLTQIQAEADLRSKNSDPLLKESILKEEMIWLDYRCKKEFLIQHFKQYIKQKKNGK
jgi:hypothetical protein